MGNIDEFERVMELSILLGYTWTKLGVDTPLIVGRFKINFCDIDWTNQDDDIALRSALILLLHRTLLALSNDAIIHGHWLQVAENLAVFDLYPWSTLVWTATYRSIVNNMKARTSRLQINPTNVHPPNNDSWIMRGFIIAF